MSTKLERVEHANALIQVIAAHGRRFFYCESKDRTAHIELDARGRVRFIDDYTGKPIYTHYRYDWRGFSNGGTLRSLVEDMRDYIMCGDYIPRWKIAIPRNDGSNIWGYSKEAAEAVRVAAFSLPIMARDPNDPREYYVISVHHTRREDRYITLWCRDNSGYCFRAPKAGRYDEARVRDKIGYYNDGCSNIAVPTDVIDQHTVMTTPADCLDGTDGPALLNTRTNWTLLLANVIAMPKHAPHPQFIGARREKRS